MLLQIITLGIPANKSKLANGLCKGPFRQLLKLSVLEENLF